MDSGAKLTQHAGNKRAVLGRVTMATVACVFFRAKENFQLNQKNLCFSWCRYDFEG
jgi:hypothetical protein